MFRGNDDYLPLKAFREIDESRKFALSLLGEEPLKVYAKR